VLGRLGDGLREQDLMTHRRRRGRINPVSHWHSSEHNIATLADKINNHNHNLKAGVVNSSDTNTTISLDGMAR
jgi:hypothetical protein